MEEKLNKLKVWFVNYIEFIVSFLIAFLVSLSIYLTCFNSFVDIYLSSGLNKDMIQVSASLLGLLITAYAIVFALVPVIRKDIIKARLPLKINSIFLCSVISMLLFFILAVILNFLDKSMDLVRYILPIQIFLFVLSSELIFIIGLILFYLFRTTRNDIKLSA